MSKFDTMGKDALRAACRQAGIAYGKLNNDGMRAALAAKDTENFIDPPAATEPVVVELKVDAQEEVKSEPAQAPQVDDSKSAEGTVARALEDAVAKATGPRTVTTGTVVAPKSLKIEKGRDESNGVRRPSAGSICRAIWDALDTKRTALEGASPTFEHVRELMKARNWSRNTAFTQFQRWKQFNGIMPRSNEGEDEGSSTPADPQVQDENTDLHDDGDEGEADEE
jgi:hypothetical protein